jgi:adenylate kinase
MNIIIVGPPGAGKGTQAARLSELLGIAHVASGDFFRAEMRAGTPLGLKAKAYVDQGGLVPDDLTTSMILDRISRPDCAKGVLLDGYPRTLPQAEALDAALASEGKGRQVDMVLRLAVREEVVLHRMLDRVSCPNCNAVYNLVSLPPKVSGICDNCGNKLFVRADDNVEKIQNRIRVYRMETWPIIQYYEGQNLVRSFDGEGDIDEVFAALEESVVSHA